VAARLDLAVNLFFLADRYARRRQSRTESEKHRPSGGDTEISSPARRLEASFFLSVGNDIKQSPWTFVWPRFGCIIRHWPASPAVLTCLEIQATPTPTTWRPRRYYLDCQSHKQLLR
jgi:hypothetical protein